MKLAIALLLSALAWSQSNGYSPAPTQTVQPGSSGGGVSSVSSNFPSSLFNVSSCNITITSSGTFQCNYATGQTANQLLGTNSSGSVGFYNPSTVLGFSPIQAGTCPGTQFVTATSATSPYVVCSSASGGGGLVPPTVAGLYGVIGAQPGSTATTVFSLVPNLYNSSTGISLAVAACGSNPCTISPSASYTKSEQIPGFSLDPNYSGYNGSPSYGSNVTIAQDMRYGFGLYYANNQTGYNQGTLNSMMPELTTYSGGVSANGIFTSDYLMQIWYDAGGVMTSQQNDIYENKITQQPLSIALVSHTPAQHISFGILTDCYSPGDCNREDSYTYGVGGITSRADEGVHGGDNQVFEVPNEPNGTISSSTSSSITFSALTNLNTAGSYRNVINTTTGVVSSGSILSISSPGNSFTTVTGSGTSWPVSTVVGTLGTQVSTPGPATVTPTFSTGSISSITTSTRIFVADPAGYEFVTPTLVSGGTFSAVFVYSHDSNVTFSVGGLSGFLFDPLADEVTNSTFTQKYQTISGTLRYAWPVAYSTSSTSLMLLVAGGGSFQQMQTRFCPAASVGPNNCSGSSSTAAYRLYPFTVVTSVQQAGGLSYTWQKMQDPNTWNSGDSAEMLPVPARIFKAGNNIVESYYPGFENFNQGFGWTFNQPLIGNDNMLGLTNSAPWTMYLGNGGTYIPPYGVHLQGINGGLTLDEQPLNGGAALTVGCNVTGLTQSCNGLGMVIKGYNAVNGSGSFYHGIYNDQFNGGWFLQTEYVTNGGVDINYNPSTGTSYIGPHSGSPNTVAVNLGDPTHLWNQFWLNNATTGCLQEASNGQVTATGSNCGSGGVTSSINNGLGTTATVSGGATQINVSMSTRCVGLNTTACPGTTTDTILASDAGGLVIYNNSSGVAVALPQANSGGNFLPGAPITITNYGTGSVTVTASTSYIGPASAANSVRVIAGTTGSGSTSTFKSCTFVASSWNVSAGVNNYDLKDCN